ncbi:hypothetical protein C1645_842339 [Glomus cerebriforme]|uniref:Uncharacterized protein n=1 Tax=Glomus cerebriforme TaxID=658196 RepID=A0A397RZS3_9GLOM|nr:hypothetical protein C1645_842339 [Glomus cerebriforme]
MAGTSIFTKKANQVQMTNSIKTINPHRTNCERKYFHRSFLITFENTDYATADKNPYLKDLTSRPNGIFLSNYFAVEHPSEPNYTLHHHQKHSKYTKLKVPMVPLSTGTILRCNNYPDLYPSHPIFMPVMFA